MPSFAPAISASSAISHRMAVSAKMPDVKTNRSPIAAPAAAAKKYLMGMMTNGGRRLQVPREPMNLFGESFRPMCAVAAMPPRPFTERAAFRRIG
jgi:hypothetical protein